MGTKILRFEPWVEKGVAMRYLRNAAQRIASVFLSVLFVFSFLLPKPRTEKVFADSELAMDKTAVEEDLGEIDYSKYPKDPTKEPTLYTFMEYGYSDDPLKIDFYALYVYVYNPGLLEFSQMDGRSSVNMGYTYESDENGAFVLNKTEDALQVKQYRNMRLKYCGATTGDNDKLFVKFRVLDVAQILTNVQAMGEQGYKRQYDLASIQLLEIGKELSDDYPVKKAIFYTGYAHGYGKGAETKSTLACEWLKIDAVELDVFDTFYRTDNEARGEGHQSQVSTVYFALPKRYLEEYGKLQRIKAEWFEYVLRPLVVTENADFWNAIQGLLGVDVRPYYDGSGVWAGEYGLAIEPGQNVFAGTRWAQGGWNTDYSRSHPSGSTDPKFDRLMMSFLTDDIDAYDPYAEEVADGTVSSNELYERIKSYNKSFVNGSLPIKDGTISADLFEDDIDDSRKINNESGRVKRGYSYYDFDADADVLEMKTWDDSDPKVGSLWGIGLPDELDRTLNPIRILKDADFKKSDKEISEDLCVAVSELAELKEFYNQAVLDEDGEGNQDEECVVVLFRFAVTDYYARQATIVKEKDMNLFHPDTFIDGDAYIAYQTVFLDFDVIQLTFNDSGKLTVLGVVADPIDVIAPITPPTDFDEGCGTFNASHLLAILFIIFIVVVVWYVVDMVRTAKTENMIRETYEAMTEKKKTAKTKETKTKAVNKTKPSKTKKKRGKK